MIGQLRGVLARKSVQEAIVDVAGVGYRVAVPLSTYYRLGEEGDPVTLRIHTHVREDALTLFGFSTAIEETLFERLISVSGVGPKLGLNILSGIDPQDLMTALRGSDSARLTRVPGVGRKTAERLILELKDKLPPVAEADSAPAKPSSRLKEDLLSALSNLGYTRAEAESGVDRALREGSDDPFEDLLRRTLRLLSGR